MLGSSIQIKPFNVRAASEHEYRALNSFDNCILAERLPDDPPVPLVEAIQGWQNTPAFVDRFCWAAWAADGGQVGGQIVARAELAIRRTEDNQHMAWFDLDVLPELRRQGLGRCLLGRLVAEAQREQRRLLMTSTTERVPAGATFLHRLGARPGLVQHTNQLVLADVDPALLRQWQAQPVQRAPEFAFCFWSGAWPEEQLAEWSQLITAGMNHQPWEQLEVEEFNYTPERIRQLEQLWAATNTEHWTMIVQEQATGRAVGLTDVWWQPNRPQLLQQGFTIVLPAYRNRGLGRWLKAAMLEKVLQERPQVKFVRTGNADSNAAMLKINHALGFKPYLAGCFWQVETEQVASQLC